MALTRSAAAPPCRAACRRSLSMAAARSVRRRRSAESANARNTALRDVPRRVASASTSLRRSSGIDTMTFATTPSIPWYTIEAQIGRWAFHPTRCLNCFLDVCRRVCDRQGGCFGAGFPTCPPRDFPSYGPETSRAAGGDHEGVLHAAASTGTALRGPPLAERSPAIYASAISHLRNTQQPFAQRSGR